MVATFFFQRTTAFTLFLIVPSLQISCFRKTKEKQYAKYDLNKRIAARLIWQLVIHSCVIFAYIISRRDGENNGFLAGVSLPPSLLARPSRFPPAQNPLSLPFQTPATQATFTSGLLAPPMDPSAIIVSAWWTALDDLIFHRDCSLTEDEVVAYVRRADPTNQEWDDWPLRMTYRINSFLRANGSNPEPDLNILNAF